MNASATPDLAGGRLNPQAGLTAEPIHRSADRERQGQGYDPADTTTMVVRPILILSPFLTRWAENMRRCPLR